MINLLSIICQRICLCAWASRNVLETDDQIMFFSSDFKVILDPEMNNQFSNTIISNSLYGINVYICLNI